MRKFLAFFLSLLILFPGLNYPAAADANSVYSIDAVDQFCYFWNKYYRENNLDINCGYLLTEDQKQIDSFNIMFNRNNSNFDYQSGIIPSSASLFFLYDPQENVYGLCAFSNDMKSDLEKAVIYTDDGAINNLFPGSSHNEQDMWSITVQTDDLIALLDCEQFTVKFTIDGKNEVFDVSEEDYKYLYDLVEWLVKAQLFSDTTYDNYLDSSYLPSGTQSPLSSDDIAGNNYSFREDLDAIDQAAKSLFYVEIYDNKYNCLGSASGFVAFDEHLFVTNQHVIDEASYLKIWDEEENMYVLDTVVMSDKTHDIALLSFPDGNKYNALEMDTHEELKRGQPVVTIGSPKGYQGTVAYGNISAFPKVEEYDNLQCIQFTAPTSHGSSGGALFDDYGKIIGITSAGVDEGQNINFAIPIKTVKELYENWDKHSYETLGSKRSWDMIGITPTPSPSPTPVPTPTPTPTPTPEPTINVIIGGKERCGVYKGETKNGIPQGSGEFDSKDEMPALHYSGNWENGKTHGAGTLSDHGYTIHFDTPGVGKYDRTGLYEGETVDGVPCGKGNFTTKNSEGITWTYSGDFKNGTFNGYGEQNWLIEDVAPNIGNFVDGEYYPTWAQLMYTFSVTEGYEILGPSISFMENHEDVFITNNGIDRSLVYDDWDIASFKLRQDNRCSKLVEMSNLYIVQMEKIEGYTKDVCFLILENDSGTLFFGYIDANKVLEQNALIDTVYFLPMNWITYKNTDNQDRQAIYCSFVRFDNKLIEPTPAPTATPTPTPQPTPTQPPTPVPTSTPESVNYGNNSTCKIIFDQTEYVLYSGTSCTLKPVLSAVNEGEKIPQGLKYTWSSDNETIAEVTNGKVIAHNEGTAVIKCALEDDPSVYSLAFVSVLDPVTEIELQEEAVILFLNVEGKTEYQLEPSFIPGNASYDELFYKTNNNYIATVNETGLVTAMNPGAATISVTAVMNGIQAKPVAKIRVDVKKIIETIEDEEIECNVNVGRSIRLSPSIIPKDATNKKLEWSSSNENIAVVDSYGNVKGIKPGNCSILCKAADEGGASISYKIKVIQPASAVKLFEGIDQYTYYPLAVKEKVSLPNVFIIEPSNTTIRQLDYKIYLDGKELQISSKYSLSSNGDLIFKVPGRYTVVANTKDGTNKSAKLNLSVYPEDKMTIDLYYARWDYVANDMLSISFEMTNKDYGLPISAVELYVYAVDTWGNKIYGKNVYPISTEKNIAPGKKLYSNRISIPNRSRISQVYCGVHKIKFADGTTKTYTVDYLCWDIK